MTKLYRILIVVILFIAAHPVFAVKVSSLYQVEVPVVSQSDSEREQAVQQGFIDVLTKISGNPDIEKNPVIKPNLHRAAYYVQEFSYASPTTDASHYLLQIRFNKEDINRLLKKANLTYWGESRPLILVWLIAAKAGGEAEIVGDENPGNILPYMKQQGKKLGLPLIFPLMDVTDLNQVSTHDVVTKSIPTLTAAGKRYSPDGLLIGKIEQRHEAYQSEWELVLNDTRWTWLIAGQSTEEVIVSLVNQMNQTLMQRYRVKTADVSPLWVKLEVTNVTQRADLTQLMQYLKQLTPVQQVELLQVSSDIVKLAVLVNGNLAAFQQNASIGQHLILKSQDPNSDQLFYEWAR